MEKLIMKYTETTNKGDFVDAKTKTKRVPINHLKFYKEGQVAIAGLSGVEHQLFFWLADKAENGLAFSNKAVREDFITYTKGQYTDSTVKFAFMELKRKKFLLERYRGAVWVNPLYVWKGSEEDRAAAIQQAFGGEYKNLKVTIEK